MNHIQKFERFDFNIFKKKKPQDEVTAIGILKQIPYEIHVRYNCDLDMPVITTYIIDLNDFEIKVEQEWSPSGSHLSLYTDGVELNCSQKVIKQIYDKLVEIHGRPDAKDAKRKKEDDDYIRKDARSRFR